MAGRPFTPQQRIHRKYPTISTEDLIKKKDLLDPVDDDDCDSTVPTIDRYTVDRYTIDRYTLYILHCLIVHTHTLSTPYIYCTLSVHLSQTSLLFATHVHILEHSSSYTCSPECSPA